MSIDPQTALATVVAVGEALPTVVKKSFFGAMSRLITGAVEVPAAWLEGIAQGFRDDTAGRTLVAKEAAQAAAARFGTDPALADRAVSHFGTRLLREQANREFVAAAAAQDLKSDPPVEDAKEQISEDLLDMFARYAESRSDEEVKLYFGKLLAEEIRRPGSFSPATMHALSTITPKTAAIFQKLCSITIGFPQAPLLSPAVICDAFGSPGGNGLEPFGLSYVSLAFLQSAGLIHSDLNAWRTAPGVLYLTPGEISKKLVPLLIPGANPTPEMVEGWQKPLRTNIINLTQAGLELRRIVHAEPNQTYLDGLRQWLAKAMG